MAGSRRPPPEGQVRQRFTVSIFEKVAFEIWKASEPVHLHSGFLYGYKLHQSNFWAFSPMSSPQKEDRPQTASTGRNFGKMPRADFQGSPK
jgi:hypothetical protein